MDDFAYHSGNRGCRGGTQLRRLAYWNAAILILLLLTTACSNGSNEPGVANVQPSTTTSDSSDVTPDQTSADAQGGLTAYSQCMRQNGISDFPDPDADGHLALEIHPGSDMDPTSSQFQAADEACKSLKPSGPPLTDAQKEEVRSQALKYSQCMRQNGISDFPDPNADGGLEISSGQGSDLDANSPAFQAADKTCHSLLPAGKGGSSTSSSGGGKP